MNSTYSALSDRRLSQELRRVEKLKENMTNVMAKKVSDALEYTSEASIYNPEETISELTTAQINVLVLFYGLLFGDLPLCQYIAQFQAPQLKSTFLRVWLADDFSFRNRDVTMVLTMLSFLLKSKKVILEDHILRIFGGLVQKYQVADCCSKKLLAVFNEEQEPKSGLNTAFRRMGSMRSWFQRNEGERTNKVEEENFYFVSKEDCEDKEKICDSELIACDNDENKPHSAEVIEGASAVQFKRKLVSETSKLKEHSGERKVQNYEVVDGKGRTLLHRLAQFGRTEAVRRLLEEGVNIDATDHTGKTALHWAALYNHYSTVKLLLKAGADVNARALEGKTPLSYARFENGVVSDTWKIILNYNGIM